MINKIIRNFIAKRVAGRSDDGIMISLRDPQKVEFQSAMMQDLLMRRGIDPMAIQSEDQLKMIINQIKAMEKAEDAAQSGIRNTESAKVFNTAGEELDPSKPIVGGTQEGKKINQEFFIRNAESQMPPPGSRGGPDDIAAPVQSAEETLKNMTEAEIKANIEAQNKKGIENILKRKNREDVYGLDDYDTTNMSDIKKEIIRTETKLGNLNPDSPDFRERAKPLIDRIEALKNKMRDDKANGGRIGYAGGSDMGTVADSKGNVGPSKGGYQGGGTGPVERPSGGGGGNNDTNYDYTIPKEIAKTVATNTAKTYAKNKAIEKLGLGGVFGMAPQVAAILGIINSVRNPQINEEDMQFAKGGRAGFFMGSQLPKGLAALRQMLNYYGKKSDAVKNPSDILKIVNPKRLNTMLDDPNIYRKFDMQKGLAAPEMIKILQKQMMGERKKTIEEMLGSAKNIKKLDDDTLKYKNDMIEDMIKKGVDRETAEEMAETISKMAESAGLGKFKDTPKLTDEGILELENILKNMETGNKPKRDLNADGGRIGLKDGMNRRTFLKLLGGLASIPIIGKIIKPLKTVKGVKNVPIIKTDAVPGKPEWFDALVNKVIIEGDDVTKKLATVEREVVHTKKINNTDEVTVYQDLNTNSVRVEYNSPNNMLEEPVDLSYKRTPPDEGAPQASSEFEVTESGFASRRDGPDDFYIDAEEVGGQSIKDLDSDVSALKQYATGEKQNLKEFVQSKKRKDKVKKLNEGDLEAQSDYIVNRQGDYVDYDDYASGGIARMLGE